MITERIFVLDTYTELNSLNKHFGDFTDAVRSFGNLFFYRYTYM